MNHSYNAYKKVCKILNVKPVPKKDIKAQELPDTTMIIVPDQVFTKDQIINLAKEFGKDQPYETYVYEKIYDKYTDEQLSGKPTGSNYRVIHISKEYAIEPDTAENQIKQLNGRKVPSVLEAIIFWYTLREQGATLDFNSTFIRHIDLEPKDMGGWLALPGSYVFGGGQPHLDDFVVVFDGGVRVAVGSNLDFSPSLPPLDLEVTEVRINGRVYRLAEDE